MGDLVSCVLYTKAVASLLLGNFTEAFLFG